MCGPNPSLEQLFIVLIFYLIYLGGEEHSKLLWVYVAPSVLFFLLGRLEGAIGTSAFLLFLGLYFLLQNEIPGGHHYRASFAGRVMLTLCIISVINYFYENIPYSNKEYVDFYNS